MDRDIRGRSGPLGWIGTHGLIRDTRGRSEHPGWIRTPGVDRDTRDDSGHLIAHCLNSDSHLTTGVLICILDLFLLLRKSVVASVFTGFFCLEKAVVF